MYKAADYPLSDPKGQTGIEAKSKLLNSELNDLYEQMLQAEAEEEAARFPALPKNLKKMPWKEFSDCSYNESKPIDESATQQSQLVNTLNPDLLKLLHSELEANSDAQSLPEFDAKLKKHIQAQFTENANMDNDESQTTEEKELWRDIIDREQNFHDNGKWESPEDDPFLEEFEGLYRELDAEMPALNEVLGLRLIYSRTYDFLVTLDPAFSIFGRNTSLYTVMLDVCMFTGLCMFLDSTKRIKSTTLSQYVYDYSRFGFSDKNSTDYIEHEGTWKRGERTEALDSHERAMRQYRHRLFKFRSVYTRRSEWSAVPKSSEHEWQLYFDYAEADGKADPQLRETLKRIKNLYNGVYEAIGSPKDDGYKKRLEIAWEKFKTKLHKIQYENYLVLCKALLEHIEKELVDVGENWRNSTYYGINLYRFEKEFCLFELTNSVRRLLKCDNEQKEMEVFAESLVLRGICFPQIRDAFCQYKPIDDVSSFVQQFSLFSNGFIRLSRLLVDKFIEDELFGNNWEALFLGEINMRATQVLYAPESIDYAVEPGSQHAFEKLLMFQTRAVVESHIASWHYGSQQKSAEG